MDIASTVSKVFSQLSFGSAVGTCFFAWICYLISLASHRLYFHPLAKFPGPKLAALSTYYEMYYEVVKRGQFTFHIRELHDRYGPIVRITPFELHVQESKFWNVLYTRPKSDRYTAMSGRFGNESSTLTTSAHALHRLRRGALNPMFSKQTVGKCEPFILQRINELCGKLALYGDQDRPLAIDKAWNAYAGDIITRYSFGFHYNQLDSDDFQDNFHDAFMAVGEFGHLTLQFPWMTPLLNMLPDQWVQFMNPRLEKLLQLQRDLRTIISRISQDYKMPEGQQQLTIFHEILQSDLHADEKSLHRLGDEAQLILGAGVMTTAWALSNATFYIANDPRIQATLRAELRDACPDPNALSYQQLEKLPYLRSCIQEGVRLSHGVSARSPRLVNTPIKYDSWTIPAGTPVSMTIGDVHFDEAIYPNPKEFLPERWLDHPKAPDGFSMDHYFVGFGKGPRSCLGINLAYMELFIALGAIFRRFSFKLYETDSSDVELAHDFFLPSPKLDSKGIRVKVTEVDPDFRQP